MKSHIEALISLKRASIYARRSTQAFLDISVLAIQKNSQEYFQKNGRRLNIDETTISENLIKTKLAKLSHERN
jgi:hypothetical protein